MNQIAAGSTCGIRINLGRLVYNISVSLLSHLANPHPVISHFLSTHSYSLPFPFQPPNLASSVIKTTAATTITTKPRLYPTAPRSHTPNPSIAPNHSLNPLLAPFHQTHPFSTSITTREEEEEKKHKPGLNNGGDNACPSARMRGRGRSQLKRREETEDEGGEEERHKGSSAAKRCRTKEVSQNKGLAR